MENIKRRLFFTGDIGCGKSSVISMALGDLLYSCGGFRTRRRTEGAIHFVLESPNGKESFVFLDFRGSEPYIDISVFSDAAISMLCGKALILDEIGGIDLASTEFCKALFKVFESDVPIIGVLKSPEALKIMSDKLCLPQNAIIFAETLRKKLSLDENTTLYRCGKHDENALLLAQGWVRKYLNDKNGQEA